MKLIDLAPELIVLRPELLLKGVLHRPWLLWRMLSYLSWQVFFFLEWWDNCVRGKVLDSLLNHT